HQIDQERSSVGLRHTRVKVANGHLSRDHDAGLAFGSDSNVRDWTHMLLLGAWSWVRAVLTGRDAYEVDHTFSIPLRSNQGPPARMGTGVCPRILLKVSTRW